MLRPWLAPIFRSVWISGWSALWVVPGVPFGQQAVRLLGAPAALGVGVEGHDVAEHRVDDPPCGLDGVLLSEQPALPLQRGADQPVIGALIAAGMLGERQLLGLRFPADAWLLAREREGDRGLRPHPEPQLVAVRQRRQPEQVAR